METEDQSGGYQAPAEFPGTPPNTPVIRCLECGNPFPAQAQFCGVCGRKLTVPPEQDSGSNNKAVSSSGMSFGGGISNNNKGTIMVSSSTFSENVAQSATNNSQGGGPDIFGAVISEGYNLIENVIGVEGLNIRIDRQVKLADLKIEPTLGKHGGPTQTLALLQGSQAIDVLPQQVCSVTITDAFGHTMVITTDQRGDPRPDASENACDVGAYESSY